jgi:uncharacterized OB-fold protein
MLRFQTIIAIALISSSGAFQFMSKLKITPPADVEMEKKVKAKFGNKSKCSTTIYYKLRTSLYPNICP